MSAKLLDRLRENTRKADYRSFLPMVDEIATRSAGLENKADSFLRERFTALGTHLKAEGESDNVLVEVFSICCESIRRTLGFKLFKGQLTASLALHRGFMVQMNTGEGKTLTAVLPACFSSLYNKGCHILTFNDYLAERDALWMGPAYRLLGINVGYVKKGMNSDLRRRAYANHITYATAREVGFDHLRDNLVTSREQQVLRPFHKAIVDEADSILIDGARIPLVIAGDLPCSEIDLYQISELVRHLEESIHWEKDENGRNAYFTEIGVSFLEKELQCGDIHSLDNQFLLSDLSSSLHAHCLLEKDVHYLVRNQRIEIIDQFTGRVAPDRRWPDGLQRALEAKEKLQMQPGGKILGSVSIQHFISMYPDLSGLTATAKTAHNEFKSFYNFEVIEIPPEKQNRRIDRSDRIFTHKKAKTRALIEEIIRENTAGRPVLVGTSSVNESENLSEMLAARGVDAVVLNARNDRLEAEIIANAGSRNAVTISTNMAGRGTDIKLGGRDSCTRDEVVAIGGLCVLGTNRHESKRIDDQLRGRSGRQGDPGSSSFYVSLEDDLMVRFHLKDLIPEKAWPEKQENHLEGELFQREIDRLQKIVEEQNFEIRKTLKHYSDLIELQRRNTMIIRTDVLENHVFPDDFTQKILDRRQALQSRFGLKMELEIEKLIFLHHLDEQWAEHLAYAAHVQDGIHLVSAGGLNPLQEFQNRVARHYRMILDKVIQSSADLYLSMETEDCFKHLLQGSLKRPAATWTYLVNDRLVDDLHSIFLAGSSSPFTAAAVMTTWPLLFAAAVRRWWRNRTGNT